MGAAYLDQASAVLRSDVLPYLDNLVATNANRVDASFTAVAATPWILALGVVALVVFVVVQTWLARRTHRRLNSGLFWATILALVASIAGALVLGTTAQKASDVQRGPYDDTFAVSQAYSLANDAKSMESFTLIKRGSGAAYEELYQTETADARGFLASVDDALVQSLDAWTAKHEEIRALDDGGNWDDAVALATSDAPDSPNAAFDAFSTDASTSLEASAAETHDALAGAGTSVVLVGWLILLAGLVAAVLSWRGISKRVEEYR